MLQNILVFDIETIADIDAYRALNGGLTELDDGDVYRLMASERLSEAGSTFMRHHLHKIVAISAVMKTASGELKVWSLGDEESSEYELINRFFQGIDRFSPTLVSWNGGGFDLPVLQYRALFHGINARRYFEIGDDERDFRYNNYLARFHWRHIDMMDVLSGFQPRAVASLDDIAKLCGFPGKLDVDGSAVQQLWDEGNVADIRNYCETDVLNTYLVYLRFEVLRGNLDKTACDQAIQEVQTFLNNSDKAHFQAFLHAWMARQR
ncbi:3'-5' exonuclease [Suttonella sp. R2A3]|uniref:3'-5' exonuclease n=1 Tax=Suttonella sp. R2A3 TaxID=2908648 RepID=UPI001F32E7AC|nr:3'-5' exonuclease [Suttonella sp. R2A3]UJF23944.1 3'-5' exonuclease [Suttonella sp. R2A3]